MPERGLERLRLGCQVHCEACHDSEHYSTILFGTHARAVIAAHPAESPLFLYLPVYQRCLFVVTEACFCFQTAFPDENAQKHFPRTN